MNKADPLIAAFRQLAVGKVSSRLGAQNATIAKDGNDKAEHFREQLRSIAQGAIRRPSAKGRNQGAARDRRYARAWSFRTGLRKSSKR